MEDTYRLKFSKEGIEDILNNVKKTVIYEYNVQFNKELEMSIVFDEIEQMLTKGLSFQEVVDIQNLEVYEDEKDDLKKIAQLCLQLVFKDIIQSNRNKIKKLKNDDQFAQAFETAKKQIVKYILGEEDSFPVSAVKCVYLLINGDENPNSQLIAAQRLVLECLPFTTDAEQAVDLHNNVFNARL